MIFNKKAKLLFIVDRYERITDSPDKHVCKTTFGLVDGLAFQPPLGNLSEFQKAPVAKIDLKC